MGKEIKLLTEVQIDEHQQGGRSLYVDGQKIQNKLMKIISSFHFSVWKLDIIFLQTLGLLIGKKN